MNNKEVKEQLKASLQKKELVKPNRVEKRMSMEVESLCDGFCNQSTNLGRGMGSAPIQESDILF